MSTYGSESFYRGTIRQSIASNTSVPLTLKVSKIPTLTAGLLTISPNTANEEIIEYSGVDGTGLTITVIKRGINPSSQTLAVDGTDYNNVTYQKSHSQNDAIRGDINHLHIIQDYGNLSTNKLDKSGGLRTGFGVNKTVYVEPATGNEVLKDTTIGSTIPDTSLSEWIDASTGDVLMVPYSTLKGSLSPQNINWNLNVIIGEALLSNDVVSIQDIPASNETQIGWQNIGDVAGNTIVTLYGYSTGASTNQIKIRTDKVSATSNLAVRVVTTSGGVATTTLVDTNATQSIVPASVTAGGELTITFPGSFTCGARGTKVAIQFCQGTFASTVVSGSNYYKIGFGTGTKSSSINENLTVSLTTSSNSAGNSPHITTFTTLRNITLVSLSGQSVLTGSVVEIKIDGVVAKTFTTTSTSTTTIIPGGINIASGKVVLITVTNGSSMAYYGNITAIATNNNITVPIQSTVGGSSYNSINTTGYAEENITTSLIENRVLVKAHDGLFTPKNRLTGLNKSNKSQGDISDYIVREGVVSGFSGLSTLTQYYVGSDGLITTLGTQKIGIAVSTTELDVAFRY